MCATCPIYIYSSRLSSGIYFLKNGSNTFGPLGCISQTYVQKPFGGFGCFAENKKSFKRCFPTCWRDLSEMYFQAIFLKRSPSDIPKENLKSISSPKNYPKRNLKQLFWRLYIIPKKSSDNMLEGAPRTVSQGP